MVSRPPTTSAIARKQGAQVSKAIWLILVFESIALSPCYADTAHCRFISEAKERLACFDKEGAPVQPSKDPATAHAPRAEDIIKNESDQLAKRMGNICRGC
jgi:hypothetical protein